MEERKQWFKANYRLHLINFHFYLFHMLNTNTLSMDNWNRLGFLSFSFILGQCERSCITLCQGCHPWGCRGCRAPPPDFGRSVNPISTRDTEYAHLITTGTPGFSDLPMALYVAVNLRKDMSK
jgi:hypothetical protein